MKATRIYTLLALLLMAGGVTMQAQELNEIFWSPDSWVYSMMFEDEHTFVANRTIVDQYSNVAETQFVRMTDEGEELASQQLFSRELF